MKYNQIEYCDVVFAIKHIAENILSLPKPALVLVAGGTCAGKGFFVNALKQRLIISGTFLGIEMDNFFKDIGDPTLYRDALGYPNFDHPEAYHNAQLRHVIALLLADKDAWMPIYEIAINKRVGEKEVQPVDIVIVEGLYAIKELSDYYPEAVKVFIEANREIRLQRRIKRDTKRYGVSKQVVTKVFYERVEKAYEEYILPQKSIADIVIINNWR